MRTKAGRPVVAATGGHGGLVERIDFRAAIHAKRHMDSRLIGHAIADPEIRLGRFAEAGHVGVAGDGGGEFHQQGVANRGKRFAVERPALFEITYRDTGVVDHALILGVGRVGCNPGFYRNGKLSCHDTPKRSLTQPNCLLKP